MLKIILLTCLACTGLVWPLKASALDLQQCIARGLELNPQVKAYQLATREAGEAVNESLGAFLPTLTASFTETTLDNGSSPERDADFLSQDSQTLSVRLSQPLFTGFAGVAGYKRARHSQIYRNSELRYMQQQLVREVKVNYFDVLRTRQLVEKWQESTRRLENQRKISAAWVEQELAPRLRLLEVEVELSNARQRLANAQAARAIAEAKLREWIVYPPDQPLELDAVPAIATAVPCDSAEECARKGLANRPELELARQNIQIARQDSTSILARNLPQASVDASWVDYNRSFDNNTIASEERDYYTVSLNVSIRPFQGGRNIAAWRRQQLAVQRLEQDLISRSNSIDTDARTRFAQIEEARSRLENSAQGLAEAREAYNFAEQSTKLGVSSLNDLLSAELRLTQAEINRIEAENALRQARVQLDYAVGATVVLQAAVPRK